MMNENDLQTILEQLRAAAGRLEDCPGSLIMPGWDEDRLDDRRRGIRAAARAVAADGLTGDEGTRLPVRQLGCLVRYIADILEPGI